MTNKTIELVLDHKTTEEKWADDEYFGAAVIRAARRATGMKYVTGAVIGDSFCPDGYFVTITARATKQGCRAVLASGTVYLNR